MKWVNRNGFLLEPTILELINQSDNFSLAMVIGERKIRRQILVKQLLKTNNIGDDCFSERVIDETLEVLKFVEDRKVLEVDKAKRLSEINWDRKKIAFVHMKLLDAKIKRFMNYVEAEWIEHEELTHDQFVRFYCDMMLMCSSLSDLLPEESYLKEFMSLECYAF
jgi:hypothetical protein